MKLKRLDAIASILFLLCAVVPDLRAAPGDDGKIVIHGTVWNSTLSRSQKADRIELILPQKVNQVLESLEHTGPEFTFRPIDPPSGPVLIRVHYGEDEFDRLLSPSRSTLKERQKISVYERGADVSAIHVTSMVQIIKRKKSLHVAEIFSFKNTSYPRKMFYTDSFYLHLPKGILNLRGLIQNEGSRLPAPVRLVQTDRGYRVDYGFKPGASGLSIEYELPGHTLPLAPFQIETPTGSINGDSRMLLWQPSESVPEITGARSRPINVLEVGDALQLTFSSEEAEIKMEGGGYVVSDPTESVINPLFDSPMKTVLALLFLFVVFLALIPQIAKRVAKRE